jgi:uncharacterized repeat protein (TIGR01451 family)
MKKLLIPILLALAAMPAAVAHPQWGGLPHPTTPPLMAQPLEDFDDYEYGISRLAARIEGGPFFVTQDHRLRAFQHKYVYTLELANLPGSEYLLLSSFSPPTCGVPYVALPPTHIAGPAGHPENWETSRWRSPADRWIYWEALNPLEDGMFAGTKYRFVVYTDAEPSAAPIRVGGTAYLEDSFGLYWPVEIHSRFDCLVPGCDRAPRPVVPEFDLEFETSPAPVAPGKDGGFTARIRNVGLGDATNATLHLPLASALRFQPGSLTLNGVPTPDEGGNPFASGLKLGRIASGAALEVAFAVRVLPGAPEKQSLPHVAQLTSDQTPALASPSAGLKVGVADRVPPVLTIASPTGGRYLQDGSLTVQFVASDNDPGIDEGGVVATLDGKPIASGTKMDMAAMAPGPHTFMLKATDRAGNQASRAVTFECMATCETTMRQVLRCREKGMIRNDLTLAYLNNLLRYAQGRLQLDMLPSALQYLQTFKAAINSPGRRSGPAPLINDEAARVLNACIDYLLAHPAP